MEVAAQLAQVREENRRLSLLYHTERGRVERLAGVAKAMYDVIQRTWPGSGACLFSPCGRSAN